MSPRQIRNYCRQALEPYKIPNEVRLVAEFPRTETGKPQKFKLRQRAMNATEEREG